MKGTFSAGVLASVMLVSAGANAEAGKFRDAEWLLDALTPFVAEKNGGEKQSMREKRQTTLAWGYIQGAADAAPPGTFCISEEESKSILGRQYIETVFTVLGMYQSEKGKYALVNASAANGVHAALKMRWPCE